MRFPIPDHKAEDAAKDFASDVRKLGVEALKMHEAIITGESDKSLMENYKLLQSQIRSMCDVEFYCVDTGKIYPVRNYVTAKNLARAREKENKLRIFYHKMVSLLKH